MKHGQNIFSSAWLKPFVEPEEPSTRREANKGVFDIVCFADRPDTIKNLETDAETRIKEEVPCQDNMRDCDKLPAPFADFQTSKLNGLIVTATFRLINRDDVAAGSRVFGSRFLDNIKYTNSGA